MTVKNGNIGCLTPMQAVFVDFPQQQQLLIHGKFSDDAKAAIEVAFTVASNLPSCKLLTKKQVQLQVGDLSEVWGSSIGLGAVFAFVSICLKTTTAYAVTGAVDIGGGINAIGRAPAKALIAKRSNLPTIFPYGNKNEVENMALVYDEKKEPKYLTTVSQLEKLMENDGEDYKVVEDSNISLFSIGF